MQRSITTYLFPALFFLFVTLPQISFAWPAQVVSVTDGDTIKVTRNGHVVVIRLYGIDTPEKDQAYGQQAKDLTNALIMGRDVDIEQKDIDHYKRIVGLVRVDGYSLNELIIRNGSGWVYQRYCKEPVCGEWNKLESIARQQKKGLWSDPDAVPPWEWRHRENTQQNSSIAKNETPTILIGRNKPIDGQGASNQFKCDGRTYCSQMTSCQEATFFLKNCPGAKMDGDRDGVPCEKQWCN